ncbi:uncharacterized protein BXIN_0055 [Babesia sp. Xinjiang]|uniref:uncharacterized protein n=1 Tax=Babesia sp. Xinjiang TaxID=462227 RepID=UPI000A254720|nr:uncharacterized protein BXIN_0055 [Babesia sp. Xinjiang]ORM39734.1 hypothetical protein BXIN_0055 [Babesia sp. Xinjiang]
MAGPSDEFRSYSDDGESMEAGLHTEGDCILASGDVGTFRTIYDAKGEEIHFEERDEKTGNWLKRKIDKGVSMSSSLPMYKSYIEHQIISKDPKYAAARGTTRRLNKRVRRFLTIMFCIAVATVTIFVSTRVINWAEERREATQNAESAREDELGRLKQTVESLRVELNKLKETSYANSVAIKAMTNGAFRLPGSDDAASKKSKFGKNKPTFNQGAIPQNFDTKQFAQAMENQGKGTPTKVDLNPIMHDAAIH